MRFFFVCALSIVLWLCCTTLVHGAVPTLGATTTGATSTGATSTGATSTGATSTGATSTGATSTGATSTGPKTTGTTTGTYAEILIGTIKLSSDITCVTFASNTFIDCQGYSISPCFSLASDLSPVFTLDSVQNVTIVNCQLAAVGLGVVIISTNDVTLRTCHISDTRLQSGFTIQHSSRVTILGNSFTNISNLAAADMKMLDISDCQNVVVVDNMIVDIYQSGIGLLSGITAFNVSSVEISGNTIQHLEVRGPLAYNSDFADSKGIWMYNSGNSTISDNKILDISAGNSNTTSPNSAQAININNVNTIVVEGNYISNVTGGNITGSGIAGTAIGILAIVCSEINFLNNEIHLLHGGQPIGGVRGISMDNMQSIQLVLNSISNLTAGNGGMSGSTAQKGATVFGIYTTNSTLLSVVNNSVVGLRSGNGVNSTVGDGSTFGRTYGYYCTNPTTVGRFVGNTFHYLTTGALGYSNTSQPAVLPNNTIWVANIMCPALSDQCAFDVLQLESGICFPKNDKCCINCTVAAQNTLCGTSTGGCDLTDYCDGVSMDCYDQKVPVGGSCVMNGTGACGYYTCNTTNLCALQSYVPRGTVCNSAAGICENDATCTGGNEDCPANSFRITGTMCRSARGICDIAEVCSGTSGQCPPDVLYPEGYTCNTTTQGVCDAPDVCSGNSTSCTDSWVPNNTTCEFQTCQIGVCTNGLCWKDPLHGPCTGAIENYCNLQGTCYCTNTSFTYPNCPMGECNNASDCGANSECRITGSTTTCECLPGYEGDGHTCTDINECSTQNNCSTFATCTNTIGAFTCTCKTGFIGNGYLCEVCYNTIGGYQCSTCPPGFSADGTKCIDINECALLNGGCDFRTNCTNTNGSYICGPCPEGLEGNGVDGCTSLCGNNVCEPSIGEDCVTCKVDCTITPCGRCSDKVCNASIGENCTTCREDCGLCVTKPCNCNGHGTCDQSGTCTCNGTWSGPACDKDNTPVVIVVPPNNPGAVITPDDSKQSFSITIKQLHEMDVNDNIIYAIPMEGKVFTLKEVAISSTNKTANKEWVCNTTLENKATLEILIYQFSDISSSITFGNKTTSYPANTLKLSVKVAFWPFKSIKNSLGLVFDTKTSAGQDTGSECKNVESTVDETGNLKWFTITIDGVVMYGQFLEEAILDGTSHLISFRLNSDNSVTAKIPHFWNSLYVDPSYSVLLGDKQDCDINVVKPNKNNLLVVAIVVPVVVVVVAGGMILALVVFPRLRLQVQLYLGKRNRTETELHDAGEFQKVHSSDTAASNEKPSI